MEKRWLQNWLPASSKVEYYSANTFFKYWNGIVPGDIHETFKPSLFRYQITDGIRHTSTENKTGQKWGQKYGPKLTLVSNMLKHGLLLWMLLRKIFYFIFKHKLIQIITTRLKLLFDSLIPALFFIVIIGILLRRSSHFNLVFRPIFSFTSRGDPNGNKHLKKLF